MRTEINKTLVNNSLTGSVLIGMFSWDIFLRTLVSHETGNSLFKTVLVSKGGNEQSLSTKGFLLTQLPRRINTVS